MKNIIRFFLISFYFFYLVSTVFSQHQKIIYSSQEKVHIQLNLSEDSISNNLITTSSLLSLSIDESKPGAPALPSKTFFVAIPPSSKAKVLLKDIERKVIYNAKVQINPIVELVNDSTLNYKKTELSPIYFLDETYPSNDVELVGYTWLRDFYCAVIKINTRKYNWKSREVSEIINAQLHVEFYDIKPFTKLIDSSDKFFNELNSIILNYDQAQNFRSERENLSDDPTSSWIDYTKDYIKLKIANDGLYRITFTDLIGYGINPASINPKTFKIFYKGSQIPIHLNGENDLSFDSNDYIEFYSERNYGSNNYRQIVPTGTDYLNYMNRYTDTTVVWLSRGGEFGKRVPIDNSTSVIQADTVSSSKVKLHFEEDKRLWYYDPVDPRVQLPYWQENKIWTWLVTGSSGSQSINFTAKNILPNSEVKSYVRLISNAADIQTRAHKNGVSINSVIFQDTLTYNYRETVNLNSKFSSALLKEGNNVFRIFGMPTKASFQQSLVDWVDIEYSKKNVAENDSILITIPDEITNAVRAIKIENIKDDAANILVYRISPSFKKFENIIQNKNRNEIVFVDSVNGGNMYLVINKSRASKPMFIHLKKLTNLRDKNRSADYIMITEKSFLQSATEYQKFISSNYRLRTQLVFTEDIYDEFSYGMLTAESLKEFLKYTYNNWLSPKPSYLLIIGDANYDYKDVYTPVPSIRKKNFVPSLGNPVSDVWFTVFDDTNIPTPQMYVGRVPAINNEQVLFYLNKHKNYVKKDFDIWNKSYLLFSGGDTQKPSELAQIKKVNDDINNKYILPKPIGGSSKHFYKTIKPASNFGDYSTEEIKNTIENGAVIVSYVGHSGTQTWDNGITKVEDLKNIFPDRNPLVSDFGCSTGKFAEPDIDAFGELFISGSNNGQAINYLGNTSWGYLSTSTGFPLLFYKQFLQDSVLNVGKAHYLAKMRQLQTTGVSNVNLVFTYCNLLFGDPIISLPIPPKPNFYIDNKSFLMLAENVNDSMDSASVKLIIKNLGRVPDDKLDVSIQASSEGIKTFAKTIKINSPLFNDEVVFKIPVTRLPGIHKIEVVLDPANKITELNENDNTASFSFNVYSSAFSLIDYDRNYISSRKILKLMNPNKVFNKNEDQINLVLSLDKNFDNQIRIEKTLDTLITKVNLLNLIPNSRYYWKAKTNASSSVWSEVHSFKNIQTNFKWYADDNSNKEEFVINSIEFDSSKSNWALQKNGNSLKLISSGQTAGSFASLSLNLKEVFPNTYFWGIASALIDTLTLIPHSFKYFLYPAEKSGTELKDYIESLPKNTVIALAICDDGAQSVLGFSSGTPVRKAIETLGSQFINNVMYRESWCIIGKKGAPKGSVPEVHKKLFEGQAIIELSKEVLADSGYVVFPIIKNSAKWQDVSISTYQPQGTSIKLFPIVSMQDGKVDTLRSLLLSEGASSLSFINAAQYPNMKLLAKFFSNEKKESPVLKSAGVNFILLPELVTNYQVVSVAKDTLEQGETANISFKVYNVGESRADNFKVNVELIKKDNSREKIFEQAVDSIGADKYKQFNVNYNTANVSGSLQLNINIDPENKITELYKDNNYYSIPILVRQNTKPASIQLTFDGNDIINGDFISPNPNIRIELNDQSLIPINDTLAVQLFLNNKRIYFSNNASLSYSYSSNNPKFSVDYRPSLENGLYTLKVLGKNATGQLIDTAGVVRKFSVNKEMQLLNVYNYPNPMKGETYFTFKLTQIPDEMRIKVYTLTGRMIKEFNLTSSELKYDFNRIYWDGRDTDGDLIANGVYLYKVILKKGSEFSEITQKLAVVR